MKRQIHSQSKKRKKRKTQISPATLPFDFENTDCLIDSATICNCGDSVDHSFVRRLATKASAEEIKIYSEIRELVKDRYS